VSLPLRILTKMSLTTDAAQTLGSRMYEEQKTKKSDRSNGGKG